MLKRPEAMLFDLDGTLFRTETLLAPAYRATFAHMQEEGSFREPTPDESIMMSCLGMLLADIWKRVLPHADEAVRCRADELFVRYELEYLDKGYGELYPHVKETLQQLKDQGVRLFIASNGLEPYVKGVPERMGIAGLFEGFYSAGEFQTASKADLVRLLLDRHGLSTAWMVGDRSSDVDAGLKNGLPVIGCDYAGFGAEEELAGAAVKIRSFDELLALHQHAVYPD